MVGFWSAVDGKLYDYVAATAGAYALTLSCTATTAPANPDLQVQIDNGDGTFKTLANGDTAFLGDKVVITPTVSPNPLSTALTGWAFDYDFHTSEDRGVSVYPRLNGPDLSGTSGTPPATITMYGPCDPTVPSTTPSTGSGCWNSVLTNTSTGGADYSATPAAGSQTLLKFAIEAQNQ